MTAPIYWLLISIQFIYNRQPFHDVEFLDLSDEIKAQAPPATRPQNLSDEESHLWNLFENCWRPNPQQRITARMAASQLLQNLV
jgi:hypothetical protein